MITVKEEFLTCPKLRRAVRIGGYEVWPMWMAMKAYADRRGDGFVAREMLPDLPGLPPNHTEALKALIECGEVSRGTDGGLSRGHGLVDIVDGGFELHDYSDHGTSREEVEERKRKAREKKARQRAKAKSRENAECPPASPGDIDGDSPGDVPVSTGARDLSPPLHSPSLDQDPPVVPRGTKPRKRKRVLPDAWVPTEGHKRRCLQAKIDINAEVAKFRDHHLAKGTLMLDWDRAFSTWLSNAIDKGWGVPLRITEAEREAIRERQRAACRVKPVQNGPQVPPDGNGARGPAESRQLVSDLARQLEVK